MKSKILALSFLLAAGIVATAILADGKKKNRGALLAILTSCAASGIAVFAAPRRCRMKAPVVEQ